MTNNQIPVITTGILAQLHGAEVNSIKQNLFFRCCPYGTS
ncbi:hypothetical protein ACXM1E_005323, partial [Escherichia coli]